ncbi:MAG: hypothetical protein V7K98_07960 [Nostoc sp.]
MGNGAWRMGDIRKHGNQRGSSLDFFSPLPNAQCPMPNSQFPSII